MGAVNGPGSLVQVFSITKPKAGVPRDRRRYLVKWRVAGRDKTRSFKTSVEAERLRAHLQMAVINGERFDMATGLPSTWLDQGDTWWSWSKAWLDVKWPQWAGHTRRSAVESLVAITPLMTRPGAPEPPANVAYWLRLHGYRPGPATGSAPPAWLMQWSVPLPEIDPALLESVLLAVTTKRDGTQVSREVARRRRTALNAVLRAAVRRALIHDNPMDRVEWRAPSRSIEVDVSLLPSYDDVLAILDHVASLRTAGARYAAFLRHDWHRGHPTFGGHRPGLRRPRAATEGMGARGPPRSDDISRHPVYPYGHGRGGQGTEAATRRRCARGSPVTRTCVPSAPAHRALAARRRESLYERSGPGTDDHELRARVGSSSSEGLAARTCASSGDRLRPQTFRGNGDVAGWRSPC